ncbi:MAG: response regulator [Deltaproteobacteria bacterium]|nr:MAG: response regulator [Deltaproteobacteria bacterium]
MKTILILEDEKRLAFHWQQVLEEAGYNVIPTHTTDESIAVLQEEEIALIICDILIRGENNVPVPRGGLSLLSYLNLHVEKSKRPPVIVVSGGTLALNLHKYSNLLNASSFLQKPFSDQLLLREINDCINKKEVAPSAHSSIASVPMTK